MVKIIILDDDPTGSQTVHGCPLLLSWKEEIIAKGLRSLSPLLFILTNTRSMSPELAEFTTKDICNSLDKYFKSNHIDMESILFISRGDSTLRGHGTLEPQVINNELGPFDATFHIPAFFEGGRTTVDGVHLLNGTPVHKTIFSKDSLFTYKNSHLASWLDEKSNGLIRKDRVINITINQLDNASKYHQSMLDLIDSLSNFSNNQSIIVDATSSIHLDTLALAVKVLIGKKRFLFRTAASFINSISNISKNSNSIKDFSLLRSKSETGEPKPGLIVIGSHVKLADQQLSTLLEQPEFIGLELSVAQVIDALDPNVSNICTDDIEELFSRQLIEIIDSNKTPVMYSSRGEISFPNSNQRIKFGLEYAGLMARIVYRISSKLGYLISKGGITSHIIMKEGLNLQSVELRGQILPGLSIVTPEENEERSSFPIITFPGNLGDKDTLLSAWQIIEAK